MVDGDDSDTIKLLQFPQYTTCTGHNCNDVAEDDVDKGDGNFDHNCDVGD